MGPFKGSWSKAGYDQEEIYFFKENQKLLEQARAKHLQALPGGNSEKTLLLPEGSQKIAARKKAA